MDHASSGAEPPAVEPAVLEPRLDGARFWGAEIDTRFRVLAVTLEPAAHHAPAGADGGDRRLQLLLHPVSTILASLRSRQDGGWTLLEFSDEQLVDVSAALGGAEVRLPLFGAPEPAPDTWGPRFSLEGRSTVGDGVTSSLTLRIEHEDLALDLFARFDVLNVSDVQGRPVDPAPAGG